VTAGRFADAVATTIGARIRQRRTELGLSQREIATEGVSYAYISRIEADQRRPSVRVVRKLAARLDVSPYWLETGEPDPARELATLVLAHPGKPLPPRARSRSPAGF
jgi:transcriptional regulator with XRE-family HTH domain